MKDSYNVRYIASILERRITAMKKDEDNWEKKVHDVREQFCKAIKQLDGVVKEDEKALIAAGG